MHIDRYFSLIGVKGAVIRRYWTTNELRLIDGGADPRR